VYRRLHLLLKLLGSHVAERRDKWAGWFWLLVNYFVSQVAIQAMMFISGIVVLRTLSKREYAIYTIVTTMGPVIAMLSDTGVVTGLSAIGRKIWQDNDEMGSLVQTGLKMRRAFGLISFVVISPILLWMLLHNGAQIGTSLILIGIVLAGTWFQLTGSMMKMVLQLRQQINVLKNVGLAATFLRFVLTLAFAYLLTFNAVLALIAATCAVGLETYLVRRSVKPQIHWEASPNPEYRAKVFSLVRRTAPLTIYFCLQSQVSVWLISIFGSAHQVADIGAVGRVGMIFMLLGTIYNTIFVPRFARNDGLGLLVRQYLQITLSYLVLTAAAVALVALFPWPFLWLLGPKYYGLANLLWLVVLSCGLGSFLGLICGLNSSKGWVPPAVISIPIEIVTQIVLLLTLDLSKTENVVIFSCLSVIPPIIFTISVTSYYLRKEEK
jgi:O-antigen/teichoic acid export membrane protein